MLTFLSFVCIMSFTPGPNTIMAMVSGQTRGLSRSLRLNLGMASGMAVIGAAAALFAGWLLQFTNIKCYLYFITGLGAFTLPGLLSTLPLRLLAMVAIGVAGTLTWTVGGQLLNRVYQAHYRLINWLVAALLVFSALDLWR